MYHRAVADQQVHVQQQGSGGEGRVVVVKCIWVYPIPCVCGEDGFASPIYIQDPALLRRTSESTGDERRKRKTNRRHANEEVYYTTENDLVEVTTFSSRVHQGRYHVEEDRYEYSYKCIYELESNEGNIANLPYNNVSMMIARMNTVATFT
jgi:hypothetical protein